LQQINNLNISKNLDCAPKVQISSKAKMSTKTDPEFESIFPDLSRFGSRYLSDCWPQSFCRV